MNIDRSPAPADGGGLQLSSANATTSGSGSSSSLRRIGSNSSNMASGGYHPYRGESRHERRMSHSSSMASVSSVESNGVGGGKLK